MKQLLFLFIILFLMGPILAQNEGEPDGTLRQHYLIKTNDNNYVGTIIEENPREILLVTKDGREVYIPQYEIKVIREVNPDDFRGDGVFIGPDKFASRYFLTFNALPMEKGEGYIQWNLYGPDFEFGLGNNISVGISSFWIGSPILANVKKSWKLGMKSHLSAGLMFGSGSWAAIDMGGFLPTVNYTYGDHKNNISITAGYGSLFGFGERIGRPVVGLGGKTRISTKISLVFDSFLIPPGKTETITNVQERYVYNPNTGQYELQTITDTYRSRQTGGILISPGLRWHQGEKNAFQFGFAGIVTDSGVAPIPMIQWYRSL